MSVKNKEVGLPARKEFNEGEKDTQTSVCYDEYSTILPYGSLK